MNGRILINIALSALILLSGCISKKKLVYTKYYLIEPPQESATSNPQDLRSDLKLEIAAINIGPAYATTKIVNRNRSNEIVYFGYHEWAVLPYVSIAEFALKFFKSTHYFKTVSGNVFGEGPNYRLVMEVPRIEMLSLEDETNAHIVVNFQYIDASTDQVVLSHTFEKSHILAEKDVNLLAKSLSELLWESLDQLFIKIVDYHDRTS